VTRPERWQVTAAEHGALLNDDGVREVLRQFVATDDQRRGAP
jgi:hypothetical protein